MILVKHTPKTTTAVALCIADGGDNEGLHNHPPITSLYYSFTYHCCFERAIN